MKRWFAGGLTLLLLLCGFAHADEESGVYTLLDGQNSIVTFYAGMPEAGDEYISGQNKHYRVESVDAQKKTATVRLLGAYPMPDVSWLKPTTVPVLAQSRSVAIYCTHSDESYEPTDGTSSDEDRGGIYDVAQAFKSALEKRGVTVLFDDQTHHPHDAGAYRRSRSTASGLVQQGVDAIFDIHRDGIPDPDEYEKVVEGESATMVRLLVGRANQNSDANKRFAATIKAVADEVYPGLIKDIYFGKGTYNQDLAPHAVLLEFGTHTISKQRAVAATDYMAEVVTRALYGDVTGAAKTSQEAQGAANSSGGAGRGIWWVLGIAAVLLIVFAIAQKGRIKPAFEKIGGTFREMTGGLLGRKRKP